MVARLPRLVILFLWTVLYLSTTFLSFAYGSFYSLSSLFIVGFNLCSNVSTCSYGRGFVPRQPPRSTSLRRIGSTFSPVLFFRLVSPYSDQYYEWFNWSLFFLPFVKGMQRGFCLSFLWVGDSNIFSHGVVVGTWTLLKGLLHVGAVWLLRGNCLFYVLETWFIVLFFSPFPLNVILSMIIL